MAAPMSSEGIVTVSYKMYRDTYRNTYQISQYVSIVEKVYHYTPTFNSYSIDTKFCKVPFTLLKFFLFMYLEESGF